MNNETKKRIDDIEARVQALEQDQQRVSVEELADKVRAILSRKEEKRKEDC